MDILRNIAAGDIAAGTPETLPAETSALWKSVLQPAGHNSIRLIFSLLTKADLTDIPQFVVAFKYRGSDGVVYRLPYKRIAVASGQVTIDAVDLPHAPVAEGWTIYVDTLPTGDDVACTVFAQTYYTP